MLEIREALCSNQQRRNELKSGHPLLTERVKQFWNNGRICGQCKNFKPIGGIVGLNGTCSSVQKREYVRPEEVACSDFVRIAQ